MLLHHADVGHHHAAVDRLAQTVNDALKSSRPYETFRKAEASIVAVVGRQAAVAATGAVKDVQLPDKAGN